MGLPGRAPLILVMGLRISAEGMEVSGGSQDLCCCSASLLHCKSPKKYHETDDLTSVRANKCDDYSLPLERCLVS